MAISFDPPAVTLARLPLATYVSRAGRILPNVRFVSLIQAEGAVPTMAQFRYVLDDGNPDLPYPDQFEDLWPVNAIGPWVVRQDDRLIVWGMDDDGDQRILFSGFAQVPDIGLDPKSQRVGFAAYGDEHRLWDYPAEGACYRDADNTAMGDPRVTSLPVQFNPTDSFNKAQPNCTLPGTDVGGLQNSTGAYPLFLDWRITRNPDPRSFWTLGKAIRYLLWRNNPDQEFVFNGDTSGLDSQLQAVTTTTGIFGPNYSFSDIVLRDYDVGNRPAIEAISDLCEMNGFACVFRIQTLSTGVPMTSIRFYRKDGLFGTAPKDVFLDDPGSINPGKFNVGSLQLARDSRKTVNSFAVETTPIRYEVSLILAPLFTPAVGDETDANRKQFISGNWDLTTTVTVRDKYRVYGFDECGDGHWDRYGKQWITNQAGDLSPILNVKADGTPGGPDDHFFVKRYRPALSKLIQKTLADRPVPCQLAISRNYPNRIPSIWDGTGTWQVIDGGFDLLDDRLGIRVNVENPEEWGIGEFKGANPQNAGNKVRGVTAQANPSTDPNYKLNQGPFTLRLTCVIPGDQGLSASVDRRATSPTQYTVQNRIDARDNFVKEVVDKSSAAGKGAGVQRDDTAQAKAYATNLQAVHETAPGTGSVEIPRFTDAYRVGDRIRSIYGRNCSLRTNAGAEQGQNPQYPTITAIRYEFDGEQKTILTLTEHRVNPQPIR